MENLIIVKFGGSAITKKAEGKFEMNYNILNQAVKELAFALKQQPKLKVIVVCGVGPFGHVNVKKYDINNGIKTKEHEKGVKVTNKDCDYVGNETKKALAKEGLASTLISGYDVCVQENKNVVTFDSKPYEDALKKGIIPISTGIMVPDEKLKWSVMSGDQVIAQLGKKLDPQKVLIGADVDGIFTADPKSNPDAKLVEKISEENLCDILDCAGKSKAVDVTGGMKGKLEKWAKTMGGMPCVIFNLNTSKNLEKLLLGKKIKSTYIIL